MQFIRCCMSPFCIPPLTFYLLIYKKKLKLYHPMSSWIGKYIIIDNFKVHWRVRYIFHWGMYKDIYPYWTQIFFLYGRLTF